MTDIKNSVDEISGSDLLDNVRDSSLAHVCGHVLPQAPRTTKRTRKSGIRTHTMGKQTKAAAYKNLVSRAEINRWRFSRRVRQPQTRACWIKSSCCLRWEGLPLDLLSVFVFVAQPLCFGIVYNFCFCGIVQVSTKISPQRFLHRDGSDVEK